MRGVAIIVALLLLAGCAAPMRLSEADDVASLLQNHRRVSGAPLDEQRREYADAAAAFERDPGEVQRLRLALMLSLPRVPWHDDARIVGLLGSFAEQGSDRDSPRRDLALALQQWAGERLRLARDEQRRVRDEQRKFDELQQKLEALRAIDREMRPRGARR